MYACDNSVLNIFTIKIIITRYSFDDSIFIKTVFSDAISLNFVSRDFCDRSSIIKWMSTTILCDRKLIFLGFQFFKVAENLYLGGFRLEFWVSNKFGPVWVIPFFYKKDSYFSCRNLHFSLFWKITHRSK